MQGVVWQYVLAGLSIVALVVINIWGRESEALNAVLYSVISATVWGGVQRQAGLKINRQRVEDGKEPL